MSDTQNPTDQSIRDANHLIDTLIEKPNIKNDAELCRRLEVAPPVISKIRHGKLPVGPMMLIRMHEISDISIRELCALMGHPDVLKYIGKMEALPE